MLWFLCCQRIDSFQTLRTMPPERNCKFKVKKKFPSRDAITAAGLSQQKCEIVHQSACYCMPQSHGIEWTFQNWQFLWPLWFLKLKFLEVLMTYNWMWATFHYWNFSSSCISPLSLLLTTQGPLTLHGFALIFWKPIAMMPHHETVNIQRICSSFQNSLGDAAFPKTQIILHIWKNSMMNHDTMPIDFLKSSLNAWASCMFQLKQMMFLMQTMQSFLIKFDKEMEHGR